jgi:exoribonuclease-2
MNGCDKPCRKQLQGIARRAMTDRGLLPDFAPPVLNELKAITKPAPATGAPLRDLRQLLWASIDNDDSRDLDQLTVAEQLPGGAVKVLVAIADVDATVKAGSAIDGHAQTNTTSVYTAAAIFPMLPEKLSTDLTSLGENQERLAIVIEFTTGADGVVTASDVYRAVVLNRAKLAYNSVAAWLDGKAPPPPRVAAVAGLDAQLRLQDRVAQLMKGLRQQHGALSLETIQTHAVFDGDVLTGLQPDEKNRAKELIENFMIGANGATVAFLNRAGFPSLRRILRSPERWARIVDLAALTGDRLPAVCDAKALEEFLQKREQADPLRFPDLSLAVVKLIGRGEYVMELPGQKAEGHFALATTGYTHSTAPNRRYPDVITQRLVKAVLAGSKSPYTNAELAQLAQHCTDQEDNASKVERQVQKSAAALLLSPRIGQSFTGLVTGASTKGTWARIFQPPVEGRIVNGYEGLDVGDRVQVKLVQTDVERGFVDFERVRVAGK